MNLQREKEDDNEASASQKDPTLPVGTHLCSYPWTQRLKSRLLIKHLLQAKLHGNEPSKGAKIDADIQAEEEEMLRKKDAKKK